MFFEKTIPKNVVELTSKHLKWIISRAAILKMCFVTAVFLETLQNFSELLRRASISHLLQLRFQMCFFFIHLYNTACKTKVSNLRKSCIIDFWQFLIYTSTKQPAPEIGKTLAANNQSCYKKQKFHCLLFTEKVYNLPSLQLGAAI